MKKVKKIVLFIALINFIAVPFCFGETLKEIVSVTEGEVVEGRDGWLFLKEELEHMTAGQFWGERAAEVSKTAKKEFADPLPVIVDFNRQLNALGIELLLMPVPPKGLIYSDKLPVDASETVVALNAYYDAFYGVLAEEGVEVVDLRKRFSDEKNKQLYCKTDTHYSGDAIAFAVEELSRRIVKRPWYNKMDRKNFDTQQRTVDITGDLLQMSGAKGDETLELNFVVDSVSGAAPQPTDKSAVLLLGDSHTLVFSTGGDLYANGAGLMENLAASLQMNLDRIGVRGSGATPSRIKLYQKGRKDSGYLANKKLVIWCFTAREFTGTGGWRKVPVVRDK